MAINNWIKNNPYYQKAPQGTAGADMANTAAGVAGILGNTAGVANSNQRMQVQEPTEDKDAYGRPMYNLGEYSKEVNNFEPKGASGGQFLSGVGQGIAAGAPLAGATGGLSLLAGAAIGGIGSLIGGGIKKNKEEQALEERQKQLQSMQERFNTTNLQSNQNLLAQQAYEDQLNMYKLPKTFL
jgi:hypothetical protein